MALGFKIIILSKNAENLRACLTSIRENEPNAEPSDIIVVDDGLPAEDFNVTRIEGVKPFIYSRNANKAAKMFLKDDVLLLNDDTRLLTKNGFSTLAANARANTGIGVLSAALTNAYRNWQLNKNVGVRLGFHMVAFVAVFIRRDVFNRIGFLDEIFDGYGFEDDDFCRRCLQAALKIGVDDGCLVEHDVLPSTFRSVPYGALLARNKLRYEKKYTTFRGYAGPRIAKAFPAVTKELQPGVTVVLTSCKRYDLLKRTIASFLKQNTYPIEQFIITEDGPTNGMDVAAFGLPKLKILSAPRQQGQLYTIDKAYDEVYTEYIFHCEDDWEFLKPGFIEDSMAIMERYPKVFSCRIVDNLTTALPLGSNPVYPDLQLLDPARSICPTLSWNPGLLRTKDYLDIGGNYAKACGIERFNPNAGAVHELELSLLYYKLGFVVASMPTLYIRHTGFKRHVTCMHEHIARRKDGRIIHPSAKGLVNKPLFHDLKNSVMKGGKGGEIYDGIKPPTRNGQ